MPEESKRQLARNEALFRETNEAIERGQWRDDLHKPVRFRCECSRLECGDALVLTLAQYEQVRRYPRRFAVVPGHETPRIETIVSRDKGHVIVEKRDEVGDTAAALDPRH